MRGVIPAETGDLGVEVLPATVYRSGEFAGYIELTLRPDVAMDPREVARHLHLVIPGELSPLEVTDHKEVGDDIRVTFFSAQVSNEGLLPPVAELVWSDHVDRSIGPLDLERAPASQLSEKGEEARLL